MKAIDLEYEDALDYFQEIDEELGKMSDDEIHRHASNDMDSFDEGRGTHPSEDFPPEAFGDVEDINNMMRNFQEFMNRMIQDLEKMIAKEPDVISEVDVEYEVLQKDDNITQLLIKGNYKDLSYNQILVTPTYDWENDRTVLLDYIRAIIVKQYRRMNNI